MSIKNIKNKLLCIIIIINIILIEFIIQWNIFNFVSIIISSLKHELKIILIA